VGYCVFVCGGVSTYEQTLVLQEAGDMVGGGDAVSIAAKEMSKRLLLLSWVVDFARDGVCLAARVAIIEGG
jgi:hypothetical protein